MAQGFTLLGVLFAVPADLVERNLGRLVSFVDPAGGLAFGLSHANEDPATDVSALAGDRWATLL